MRIRKWSIGNWFYQGNKTLNALYLLFTTTLISWLISTNLKMWLRVAAIISQLFSHYASKMCFKKSWNEIGTRALEIRRQNWTFVIIYAHVFQTTAKQVILRRGKNEKVCAMSTNKKCTRKACKTIVFHCQICKFLSFLLQSSSWLRKGPSKRLQHLLQHPFDFVIRCWKVAEWCWTLGWANGFYFHWYDCTETVTRDA